MSQVFIKIIAHTDEESIPYFENLFSQSGNKINVNLVPNVWYDINALFKFVGNDLAKSNLLSNVNALYKIVQPYYNYELKDLYAYYYPTKEDADNKTNLITSTILHNKTNQYKDNGDLIPLSKTGEPYDIDLNTDKTVAIVYHVGDPNSKETNPPYVHYEKTYSSYLGITSNGSSSAVHVYDRYHDITTSSVNRNVYAMTALHDLPSPQEFVIYINGKKDSSGTLSQAQDRINFTRPLQFNDKVDFYLPSEVPTPPVEIKPVYYNLPTIEHVTFSPTKAELGKKTTIVVTPDTGYTINRLTFFADDENIGGRIFTSSYKNGIIELDLTSYSKDDLNWANQTIEHSEDIKKLEYGTYVLPKITGITFTYDGSPVTSVQLGKYYNFGVVLDSHYSFLNDKGKGFVLKNDDGTTTNLSSWTGTRTLGVHFENYTTADQLKNAYWDINIQKIDHSDEHEKQVPIQLELTHATADKNSILENSTETITLTADNGYIFDDDIVYYSYDINYDIYQKLTEKANKQNIIKIDLTTGSFYDYDKFKDNPVNRGDKPYIKAVATSPTVKPTGTNSINLYSMTDGELNTFMNSVLLQFNSTQNGTQTSLANFLDFVNQVYRIPLNIPNDLLTPVKQVHSGKWNINVNTNQITQDHFSINFDPIKVTPHYQNANDYNSITVSLVIPFAKEIELNINDVMNNTIKITYNVDLLQGKTTIIVSNDTGTIYTNQIDISTQLEFYGLYYDKTIGGLNSTYINNVLQPYISISYHKPITNLISYSTNENGMLKDYNGFVRVSHGTLTGNMNDTEYNEIMNLLYGGIKIGTKRN